MPADTSSGDRSLELAEVLTPEEILDRALDPHFDNGRRGGWIVRRSSGRVALIRNCTHAREALDRAMASSSLHRNNLTAVAFHSETRPEGVVL